MEHKDITPSTSEEFVDVSPVNDETQGINIIDAAGYPVLTFDADDYREYVEDMGLTTEQEDELLEALWSIIVQFVNMGFGIEPVQRALLDAPSMETPMMNGSNNSQKEVK